MTENKIVAIVSPPYEEAMSGGGINKKGYKGKYGEDPTLKDRVWSKENLAVQRKRITEGKAKMQRPDAIMNETNISAKGYFQASYSPHQDNIGNLKAEHNQELDFDITKYHKCLSDLYWFGCYEGDSHFKQYFEPSTYAHPAKISPLLADRIFKHLEKLELLKEGMTILDFMAGSGRIPLMASLCGYKGLGVELEPHFVKMCNDNKKFVENKIGRKLDMEIVQGDSRQLSKLLNKSDVAVVSPPYDNSMGNKGREYNTPASKFLIQRQNQGREEELKYSDNPSNIGNLKYKEMVGVVSPPYQDSEITNWKSDVKGSDIKKRKELREEKEWDNYSQNPENIGNLKDTAFVGITSPPYDNRLSDGGKDQEKWEQWHKLAIEKRETATKYNSNLENIGNQNNESYLSAMLQVYKEASKVCPIICTVTKNPTRAGKLRRLDLDTISLLQMAGYQIVDYHRAILFKTYEQSTLTGETKKEHKGRLSFFKRLSLNKGNQASQWEDILIAVNKKEDGFPP